VLFPHPWSRSSYLVQSCLAALSFWLRYACQMRAYNLSHKQKNLQRGVALLLVIFIVALCSILVVNLAYSANIGARLNAHSQQGLRAEYLLKSALNLARVLLKEDTSPEDARKDPWGLFMQGILIPPELLGLTQQNVRVSLEIRPEESKFPLKALMPPGQSTPDIRWRDALQCLFQRLGFDEDQEEDQSGFFPRKNFSSAELVANLIDYMDSDNVAYADSSFAQGIEGSSTLPEGFFPNERIQRVGELASIPGFTPTRIRKLTPLVATNGNSKVNINVAPAAVLACLSGLSGRLGDSEVQAILSFRDSEEGPFESTSLTASLESKIGEPATTAISGMYSAESNWFQVLAKVEDGSSLYFLRAYVSQPTAGELPIVRSVELF
jgi:type II secretory pathway component PulK